MSFLQNILNKAKNAFTQPELVSPLPNEGFNPQVQAQEPFGNNFWDQADLGEAEQTMAQYGGQPRVLGATDNRFGGRNPNWEKWSQLAPKSFQELLSGARIASENTGVPADLLMDISGSETSGGQILTQRGSDGLPVPNGGRGYYQFEEPTLEGLGSNIDPYSATESAQLAAELIKGGQLSRWGIDKDQSMKEYGKYWGTLDNPNNNNGSIRDFYQQEELNPYLSKRYKLK